MNDSEIKKDIDIYSDISNDIFTSADVISFIEKCEAYLLKLYQQEPISLASLQEVFGEKKGTALDQAISKQLQTKDVNSIEEFFNGIIAYLHEIKVLKVTLYVDPDKEVIHKITDWVGQNKNEKYILDINVDPAILGGVQLAMGGIFVDASLRKQVDEYLSSKKDEIIKNLGV